MQRRHIFLPGRELFQIIAGSEQPRRHIMLLRLRSQQHFQQGNKGRGGRRADLLLLQLGQFFFAEGARLTDRRQQPLTGLALGEIL